MHFANRYQSIFIEEKLSEMPLLTESFYVYISLAKKHRLLHLVAMLFSKVNKFKIEIKILEKKEKWKGDRKRTEDFLNQPEEVLILIIKNIAEFPEFELHHLIIKYCKQHSNISDIYHKKLKHLISKSSMETEMNLEEMLRKLVYERVDQFFGWLVLKSVAQKKS